MSRTLNSVSQSPLSLAPVWKCHSCIVLVGFCSQWSFGIFRRISWSTWRSLMDDGADVPVLDLRPTWHKLRLLIGTPSLLLRPLNWPWLLFFLHPLRRDNGRNSNVSLHFQVAAPGLTPAPPFVTFDPRDWPERLLSSRSAFSLCACSSSYLMTNRRVSTCALSPDPLPHF